jgi:divalent metal cation (Fe/Co/Zn/Cd) transporter
VAIGAGVLASSIALVGFGVDSFIEVLSGLVMFWRLRAESSGRLPNEEAERRAIKLIALTFFILAAYVTFESVRDLLAGERAESSMVGLILTAVSLVVMPVLARNKRRLAREMGSASLQADSTETQLCVYLSATVFLGLAANTLFGWWWMDSLAALVVAAIAIREGHEAWTKEDLCCD